MGNPYRGEVTLVIDGEAQVMRLSLGALAELEVALGESSLVALVERFEGGSFSAGDLMALLSAGLGWPREQLAQAQIEGGPMAAARAAARLLSTTFSIPEDAV